MKPAEFPSFAAAWVAAWSMYGKPPVDVAVRFAFDALADYDLADITRALSAHVRDADRGQFTPKPSDIVRLLEGDGETAALRAWSKIEQAVRSVGPYQDVVFDDGRIHAVVEDMGGWIGFGGVTDDEWPFKRNEFVRRYRGERLSTGHPPVLQGIATRDNAARGVTEAPQPVLIGDRAACLRVAQAGTTARRIGIAVAGSDVAAVIDRARAITHVAGAA